MYQMVIVDDEPIVREGLKKLITWEDYGFQICSEGIDGIDGLNQVLKHKPDLVLVDVKMPGLNGLELIRRAKEHGHSGYFIILTGYSDFEFAKSAISLGVKDYLLKPVDEDELAANLNKIKKELDERQNMKHHILLNEHTVREEILRRLLLYSDEKEELHRLMASYPVNLNYSRFCIAILSNEKSESGILEFPSKEKLIWMLKGLDHVEEIAIEDKWVILSKGRSYQELLERLVENNTKLEQVYHSKYFIAVGHDVLYWEDIHFSYECANMLLEYQFTYRNEATVSIRALEESKGMTIDHLYEDISMQIEIGNLEALKESFDTIEEYCKGKLLKEAEIRMFLVQNMFLLRNVLEQRYATKKAEFPSFDDLAARIKKADTFLELLTLGFQYCKNLSEIIAVSGPDNVILRVKAYLEKNYQKDLKLEGIAKLFHYNSAYLGKLFKKETGENFNNYLDQIRINNAKRMLMETDYKVYQVSEQVGYSNIDYFYSKFKRYVGISPKEFKRSI